MPTWQFNTPLSVMPGQTVSVALVANKALYIHYSAVPYLRGVQTSRPVTDGAIELLPGSSLQADLSPSRTPRYFNGFVNHCSASAAAQPPPPALPPSQSPPRPPQPPAPENPPGVAEASTLEDFVAAVASPAVWLILLKRSLTLPPNSDIVVRPGAALTVRGDTASCLLDSEGSPDLWDYQDYGATLPSPDPLPRMCSINALRGGRHFNVSAGSSLLLDSVLLLGGRSRTLGGAVAVGPGGSLSLLAAVLAGNQVSGGQGGAVFLAPGASLIARRSTFRDSVALLGGGAKCGKEKSA